MRNMNEVGASGANETKQMEMGFAPKRRVAPSNRVRRAQQAQWWFQQMRRVVDQAMDWRTPAARPEQGYLTLAGRRN